MSDRELDAQVAERVMGWTGFTHNSPIGYPPDADLNHVLPSVVPVYSTDISAAMQVVEKMRERHGMEIESNDPQRDWSVRFYAGGDIVGDHRAVSLPEAICRAALAALNEDGNPV